MDWQRTRLVTKATGTAEREAALKMLKQRRRKKGQATVGGDKSYDTHGFVEAARKLNATPHVAQNAARRGGSAIDERTTRHAGYAVSQRTRKAGRGNPWLDEDRRHDAQDQAPRKGTSRLDVYLYRRGLQPDSNAKHYRGGRMIAASRTRWVATAPIGTAEKFKRNLGLLPIPFTNLSTSPPNRLFRWVFQQPAREYVVNILNLNG